MNDKMAAYVFGNYYIVKKRTKISATPYLGIQVLCLKNIIKQWNRNLKIITICEYMLHLKLIMFSILMHFSKV